METHLSRGEVRLTLSEEDVRRLAQSGRIEGEVVMGQDDRRRLVVVAGRERGSETPSRGIGETGADPGGELRGPLNPPESRGDASVEQMSVENEPATDR
jgi:hypothetical protein